MPPRRMPGLGDMTRSRSADSSGDEPNHVPEKSSRAGYNSLCVGSPAGRAFSLVDEKKLPDDSARQARVAFHAVGLSPALRSSREGIVAAREKERRRVRRDPREGELAPIQG